MPGRASCLPLLAWIALALAPARAWAQLTGVGVSHRLSFPEIHLQYVQVESEFPVSGGEVVLPMPTWTPGSYLIRNYDSRLEILAARDAAGQALEVSKIERDAWRLGQVEKQRITITYRVHAADLNVSASWVSPEFILINGASVFLYTLAGRDLPQSVTLDAPPGLGRVMTSLPISAGDNTWLASDFDELLDSPLVVSRAMPFRFEAGGQGYALVNVGDAGMWDGDQAARDVRKIVKKTNDLWGVVPFDSDYWFFNILVERDGGLEHDHSTVMMSSRWQMRDRKDYVKWLSLVSHEYFHAWNVRRMRPVALARYDYRKEQYTGALWIAEGITSYYDDLLLSRARIIEPTEYFQRLAINFHTLELTPGRLIISLEQASRDAWTRHYQPDANSINANISYYTKGAVVAFALDTRIREVTRNRDNLDDVMREMYQFWGSEPYPDHAFGDAVEKIGGREVRQWLEPLITTRVDPDVDAALDWYGLELDRHPEKTAGELNGEPVPAGFGINWSEEHDTLVVGAVVHGLSAAAAGIIPGDELLAINDERITRENLEDRKRRLLPGETVEFLLARHGRLIRLPITLGVSRPASFEIKVQGRSGDRQLGRLESWLGQSLQTK